jgi:hypothetical protein
VKPSKALSCIFGKSAAFRWSGFRLETWSTTFQRGLLADEKKSK